MQKAFNQFRISKISNINQLNNFFTLDRNRFPFLTWDNLKMMNFKKSSISLKFKKILLWISLVTLIPLWQFLHPRSTLHTHYALTVHKSIMELIRYCFLDQKYTLFHHEINTIKNFSSRMKIWYIKEQRNWDCIDCLIMQLYKTNILFYYYCKICIKYIQYC